MGQGSPLEPAPAESSAACSPAYCMERCATTQLVHAAAGAGHEGRGVSGAVGGGRVPVQAAGDSGQFWLATPLFQGAPRCIITIATDRMSKAQQ